MKNKELSRLLTQIAELLSLGNENYFRIRSYERASQVIESLPEPIEEVFKRGGLEDISGVGHGISEKIEEFIKTGKISYLEELKKQYPESLIEMMEIPGIGPKKAKVIYDKFKIAGTADLAAAAKAGKIRELPGFGVKTEAAILEGIEFKRKSGGRILLSDASLIAEEIIRELKKNSDVVQVSPAGSLRRLKDSIGDIDILCTVKKGAEGKVIKHFTTLKSVKRVLAAGGTKATVITEQDIQVDLRVIDNDSFGAALQYFTGSKEHNVVLRGLAKDKGLLINEYGVYKLTALKNVSQMSSPKAVIGDPASILDSPVPPQNRRAGKPGNDKKSSKTGLLKEAKPIASKTEKDVYRAIGLPLIPPSLRENRGEIEAALASRLPKILEVKDIKGDIHVHSKYSDGASTIEELANRAVELGYEWLIVTDHSQSLKIAHGLHVADVRKKIDEIRKYNEKQNSIKILCGTEVDILSDSTIDYPESILREFDFVLGAIHTGFKQGKAQLMSRITAALENPLVHCLAHPTGRLINKREPYDVDMEKILEAAKKHNKMIEINAFPDRLDLFDIYCKRAKEMGVTLAIGSDSHDVSQLENIRYGVYVAQRGWLEKGDVINTLPLDKLLKKLKR
jgi:DNA polymerase (family 10)